MFAKRNMTREAAPCSSATNSSRRSRSTDNSIGAETVSSAFGHTEAKISKYAPPAVPLVIVSSADRCSALACSSMITCRVPFPSWIAPGQE